ncbi:MAG: hypothetical protein Q7R73_04920 [bacterium]|nr:hypothetical protein [bacterium]
MNTVGIIFILLFCFFAAATYAGNIDATSRYAWGENVGWINFEPDLGGGVLVEDFSVRGYAWGENIGWVNMNPTEVADGGVKNDGYGNLSGFAWGENVGWINFDPYGDQQVIINGATGDFTGYAWGENIGWISFNCSNTSSCETVNFKVNTTWRKKNSSGGGSTSGAEPAGSTGGGTQTGGGQSPEGSESGGGTGDGEGQGGGGATDFPSLIFSGFAGWLLSFFGRIFAELSELTAVVSYGFWKLLR